MQLQIDQLTAAVRSQAERIASMETRQEANHNQNRGDIHRLNNAQQDLLDALHDGLEKIADKIGGKMDRITGDVVTLKVQFSRAMGYAAGMAAIAVLIFEFAKTFIEKH